MKVLWLRSMTIQELEQRPRFSHAHTLEVEGEGRIDVEHLAPAQRVRQCDGVDCDLRGRIGVPQTASFERFGVRDGVPFSTEHVPARMHSVQAIESLLQFRWQRVEGLAHVHEERVATMLWNVSRQKDR